MAMPSCHFGNVAVAERAEATLLFPEREQLSFPFQVVCHFHIETLFKVGLPFGIVWVCCTLDFDVPSMAMLFPSTVGWAGRSLLPKNVAMRATAAFNGGEVFLLNPFAGFLWMSPFCPLPPGAKDCMVHLGEGFLADHMPVIVRPSSNFRIQLGDEITRRGLLVLSYDLSDTL